MRRAVHGFTSTDAADPFLFVCPVRPEWTDPTGLTGYYDVLSNRYVVPPFLEAVLLATAHRDSPVFVVLDEMNLARVEYYFSDVLSAVETGEPLQLHSSGVPLEGSTGTTVPAALPLPPNLYITGTVNIDETTNPVSDKVLDRAIVIDMSAVDLPGFLDALESARTGAQGRQGSLRCAAHRSSAADGRLRARVWLSRGRGGGAISCLCGRSTSKHHAASVTDDLMVQKVLVKLARRRAPAPASDRT